MSALDDANDDTLPPIPVTIILDIGGNAGSPLGSRGADIYASVAMQMDGFSLMMVAYGDVNSSFVGMVSTIDECATSWPVYTNCDTCTVDFTSVQIFVCFSVECGGCRSKKSPRTL